MYPIYMGHEFRPLYPIETVRKHFRTEIASRIHRRRSRFAVRSHSLAKWNHENWPDWRIPQWDVIIVYIIEEFHNGL